MATLAARVYHRSYRWRRAFSLSLTGVLLSLSVTHCAWVDPGYGVRQSPEAPVKMLDGGLLLSRSGEPELGLTLTNNLERTVWAHVYFETPGGLSDCLLSRELSAQEAHFYGCPQTQIQADATYPVRVLVFADLDQTQLLDELTTEFRFPAEDAETVPTASDQP